MEEKLGINISYPFACDISKPIAGSPPTLCIVVWILDRNHPYLNLVSKGFLEEKPGAARVRAFGYDVKAFRVHIMLVKPILQRHRRVVRSISANDMRRYHL